jgi:hypothetical protein
MVVASSRQKKLFNSVRNLELAGSSQPPIHLTEMDLLKDEIGPF